MEGSTSMGSEFTGLTPLDSFVLGIWVYGTPLDDAQTLVARILAGCELISQIPGVLERGLQSFVRWYNACIDCDGHQFLYSFCKAKYVH